MKEWKELDEQRHETYINRSFQRSCELIHFTDENWNNGFWYQSRNEQSKSSLCGLFNGCNNIYIRFSFFSWRWMTINFGIFFSVFKMNGAHAMDQIWFALQIQWKHFLIRMNIPTKLSKQCKSYIMCIHCNIAFVKYIYFLMYSFMFKSTILFLIHICIKRLFFWQKEKERFQFLEDFFLFFFSSMVEGSMLLPKHEIEWIL